MLFLTHTKFYHIILLYFIYCIILHHNVLGDYFLYNSFEPVKKGKDIGVIKYNICYLVELKQKIDDRQKYNWAQVPQNCTVLK